MGSTIPPLMPLARLVNEHLCYRDLETDLGPLIRAAKKAGGEGACMHLAVPDVAGCWPGMETDELSHIPLPAGFISRKARRSVRRMGDAVGHLRAVAAVAPSRRRMAEPAPPPEQVVQHCVRLVWAVGSRGISPHPCALEALCLATFGATPSLTAEQRLAVFLAWGDLRGSCPTLATQRPLFIRLAGACQRELGAATPAHLCALAHALGPLAEWGMPLRELAKPLLDQIVRQCWQRASAQPETADEFGPVVLLCGYSRYALVGRKVQAMLDRLAAAYRRVRCDGSDKRSFTEVGGSSACLSVFPACVVPALPLCPTCMPLLCSASSTRLSPRVPRAMPAVMRTHRPLPPLTLLQNCQWHQVKTRCDSLTARTRPPPSSWFAPASPTRPTQCVRPKRRQADQLPEGFILTTGSSFTASGLALVSRRRTGGGCWPAAP